MIIAGITGTIGTGKSTVAKMFAELGAFIIDSDAIARQVVEPGKPAWQGIVNFFGREILDKDGKINRQKLAAIVFNNPEKLQKLNCIVHPEVLKEDQRQVENRKAIAPKGVVIKDIPLLLEIGPEVARTLVQKIIVVSARPDVQIKRLVLRGMSAEDARSRIAAQIPVKEKMKYADFIIDNNGSLDKTRQQVKQIYDQLTNMHTEDN